MNKINARNLGSSVEGRWAFLKRPRILQHQDEASQHHMNLSIIVIYMKHARSFTINQSSQQITRRSTCPSLSLITIQQPLDHVELIL